MTEHLPAISVKVSRLPDPAVTVLAQPEPSTLGGFMQSLRVGAEVLGLTEVEPRHIHEYLVLLDASQMPLTVDETLAIHFVRILHSAGMIEAEIPAKAEGGSNYSTPARVSRLTQWGREVAGKEKTKRVFPGARELWP